MDLLINFSRYLKFQKQFSELYDGIIDNAAAQNGLTKQEAEVLLFFGNNPEYTTAIDAVKMRGFSKSYVSKAVEKLVGKGLVVLEQDKIDRRLQHIRLTDTSKKVIDILQKAQLNFFELITHGFTKEDEEDLKRIIAKLLKNVR